MKLHVLPGEALCLFARLLPVETQHAASPPPRLPLPATIIHTPPMLEDTAAVAYTRQRATLSLTLTLIAAPDGAPIILPFHAWSVESAAAAVAWTLYPAQAQPLPPQSPEDNNPTPWEPSYTEGSGSLLRASSMTYDELGRKTSMMDTDMGHWTYGYDANGNLIRQEANPGTADHVALCFYYDALNRLGWHPHQCLPGHACA